MLRVLRFSILGTFAMLALGFPTGAVQEAYGASCKLSVVADTTVDSPFAAGDQLHAWRGVSLDGASHQLILATPVDWFVLSLEFAGFEQQQWQVERQQKLVWIPSPTPPTVVVDSCVDAGNQHVWQLDRKARELRAAGKWSEAVEIRQQLTTEVDEETEPLLAALLWREQGWDADDSRDRQLARESLEHAARLWQKARPGSLALADTAHLLGTASLHLGDLSAAEQKLREALEIRRRLAPRQEIVARSANNLGLMQKGRGYLREAEELLQESLEILQRLRPGTVALARSYNNLGALNFDRGDLLTAIDYFRRSKDLRHRLAPDSPALALSLNNLAGALEVRGDIDQAEIWYRQALEIRRRTDAGPLLATSLENLSRLASTRGEHDEAIAMAREALEVSRQAGRDSLRTARSARTLARASKAAGDLSTAESYIREALEVYENSRSEGHDAADAESDLGRILLQGGRLNDAEAHLQRALELLRRMAPGSRWEAQSLQQLSRLAAARDQPRAELDWLNQALAVVEAIPALPGGTADQRAAAHAEFVEWYRRAAELLVDADQPTAAFDFLERSRGRGWLAMVASRDPLLDQRLSPPQEARLRRLGSSYERGLAGLAEVPVDDPQLYAQRLAALADLRDERRRLLNDIRQDSAAPGLSQTPSVELEDIAKFLEPQTLMVIFSIGTERSLLFAVEAPSQPGSPARLSTHPLEINRRQLTAAVETFRLLLQSPTSDVDPLRRRGAELFTQLLAPIAPRLETAQRLVIVADGPLHRLPFAVLVDADGRWLIERLPLVHSPSVTVLAELRQRTTQRPTGRFIGLADPETADGNGGDGGNASSDRADQLSRLPASRGEVRAGAKLFASVFAPGEVWLGEEATETRAKAGARHATVLHFASHGVIDDRFPLDSYLALAASDHDNGQLHAWEVVESLRTEAELVTLSGCETGLGQELDGEGLVGLVWAFFHAGARSALASLWRVDDGATAALMSRFYGELAQHNKAQALRQAQLALLRGAVSQETTTGTFEPLLTWVRQLWDPDSTAQRDLAHPFYWSGFELIGDWRPLPLSSPQGPGKL